MVRHNPCKPKNAKIHFCVVPHPTYGATHVISPTQPIRYGQILDATLAIGMTNKLQTLCEKPLSCLILYNCSCLSGCVKTFILQVIQSLEFIILIKVSVFVKLYCQ